MAQRRQRNAHHARTAPANPAGQPARVSARGVGVTRPIEEDSDVALEDETEQRRDRLAVDDHLQKVRDAKQTVGTRGVGRVFGCPQGAPRRGAKDGTAPARRLQAPTRL